MEPEEVFAEGAVYDPSGTDTPNSKQGSMLWCMHCERCYTYGWYRVRKDRGQNLHMCPYEDCDGDVFMDAKRWSKIQSVNAYPEEPELGKRYPMYGDS